MDTAQEFLTLFNQIEQYLNTLSGSTEHFGLRRLIDTLSKTNVVIAAHKVDLVEFLELRNAIVHKSTGEPIAEPDPQVVEQLRSILEELTHPLTAMDLAATPVFTSTTASSLTEVLEAMASRSYTSIPVYHENHFVGVFSDRSILLWLHDQPDKNSISLGQKTVGELQQYFHDEDDKYHSYRFISKDTTIDSIRQQFISFLSMKKRLGALFVTATGKNTEKIDGIITAWDLPQIK